MIYDSFMVNDELDMLECRLVELENVPDLVHVAVEANVDHQDHPKPFHVSENIERFAPWKNRLRVVRAKGLPPKTLNPDPWARELAQREFSREGMSDASPSDVVLHGDLDEIPNPFIVRALGDATDAGLSRVHVFKMVWCSFAVDWVCPEEWFGTVATKARNVASFGELRTKRTLTEMHLERGGFHLGWLGGNEAQWRKLGAFCHPEIRDRIADGLGEDVFLKEGWHVDGQKMIPVDVDERWPRYVRERRCPENWFRAREDETDADLHGALVRDRVVSGAR